MDRIFGDKYPVSPFPSSTPSFNVQTGLSIVQPGELGSLLRNVVVVGPTTVTNTVEPDSMDPLTAMKVML